MSDNVNDAELEAVTRGLNLIDACRDKGEDDDTTAADIIADVLSVFPTSRWEHVLTKAARNMYGERYGITKADNTEVLLVGMPEVDQEAA